MKKMREIRERRVMKKRLYSVGTSLVLLVVFGFLAKASWNVYGKERESREKAEQAKTELMNLQTRAQVLEMEIARLNTKEGIEKEIRENFRMARDGENLAIILNANEPIPTTTPQGIVSKVKAEFKKVLKR